VENIRFLISKCFFLNLSINEKNPPLLHEEVKNKYKYEREDVM